MVFKLAAVAALCFLCGGTAGEIRHVNTNIPWPISWGRIDPCRTGTTSVLLPYCEDLCRFAGASGEFISNNYPEGYLQRTFAGSVSHLVNYGTGDTQCVHMRIFPFWEHNGSDRFGLINIGLLHRRFHSQSRRIHFTIGGLGDVVKIGPNFGGRGVSDVLASYLRKKRHSMQIAYDIAPAFNGEVDPSALSSNGGVRRFSGGVGGETRCLIGLNQKDHLEDCGTGQDCRQCGQDQSEESNGIIRRPLPQSFAALTLIVFLSTFFAGLGLGLVWLRR